MVLEVIAGHGSEHDVRSPSPHGFMLASRHRPASALPLLDLTEGTAAGADRSQQSSRRTGETLAAVGTTALLADRVQPVLLHQALNLPRSEAFPIGRRSHSGSLRGGMALYLSCMS